MSDSTAVGIAAVARACAEQMGPSAEDRAIQAGIDATMRDVIKTRSYNPVLREPSPTVTVQSGVRVEPGAPLARGWAEPPPLALPAGQDAIERMTNAALPHGRTREKGRRG
jgi:hypothetical protein